MRVSLFIKILATYVLVVFFSITVVGGLQLLLVQDYLMDTKEKELLVKSQDLADIIKPLLISGQDPHPVISSLNRADRILGTEAWVIDNSGKVLAASADHIHCEGNVLEATDLQQLKSGQVSLRRGQSQFFQEAVIRAAAPVLEQGKFIGAVILYTPVAGINDTFSKMRELQSRTAILGIILSVILGFFLSRYITRPLREVSQVARRIAEGDFEERVRIKSRDELGQLGETFNYMTQRLEDYEKMRREFVANVSHELRSPLTSIQGFMDALIEGKNKGDEQEKAKYLSIIQKETSRLSKLINELLDLSRFDAQVVHFDMEAFPITTVINRATASLKPQLDEKNLTVKSVVPKDLPYCYGDEDRIEQVVHNLLQNAIRYSPKGEKILISARLLTDELLVEVADNGPGIPKQELARIWERFYRVDKARSRGKGGMGLGLAIVEEIIKKHGGQVTVESEPGEGAVFGFTLPIVIEEL